MFLRRKKKKDNGKWEKGKGKRRLEIGDKGKMFEVQSATFEPKIQEMVRPASLRDEVLIEFLHNADSYFRLLISNNSRASLKGKT